MAFYWYYQQMNKAEKSVYDTMLAGFAALSSAVRILRPDTEGFGEQGHTFGDIFFRLRLDHPEIFYVTGCNYRYTADADYAELLPEYMFDKLRILEHRKALEARLTKLLHPAEHFSEAEKEKFVHDFICTSVRYDKLKKPYSHEVIGPLQNGVGVCEGMSKTVKLMCDRLGLECMIAVSEADLEVSRYLHAWNVVKLGGQHYHLDATFDNSLGSPGRGDVRYDYFNLDDKHIFRDHRPLLYPVPQCTDSGGAYYRQNKQSYTKIDEIASRVEQALRKKRDGMVFHWRGGYLTQQVLSELAAAIGAAAAARSRSVSLSVNFPQAVVKLMFTDGTAPQTITEENAEEKVE